MMFQVHEEPGSEAFGKRYESGVKQLLDKAKRRRLRREHEKPMEKLKGRFPTRLKIPIKMRQAHFYICHQLIETDGVHRRIDIRVKKGAPS